MVAVLKLVGLAQKRRVMLENEGESRNSEGIELRKLIQVSKLLTPNLVVGKSIMSSEAYFFYLKIAGGMMIFPIKKMHRKQIMN